MPLPGHVYLLGAGPGDPELLTIKAARILQSADIVLHDSLVSPEVLAFIPVSAERIDVGKRAGFRLLTQDNINSLLVDAARRHEIVVRLKGGDPFVFGRGGEEAQALLPRYFTVFFDEIKDIAPDLGDILLSPVPRIGDKTLH